MKPLFVPLLDNGNGSVMASFMMDHSAAFGGREIHMIRASDSHANRGMNKIANAFLESPCDVWINIDADIRFRKMDIDNLLSHDLPLVYGIYPKKDEAAEPCLCTFAIPPVPDPVTGLAEVRRCGRGFMLVKREVLEAMKEDNGGPAFRYHNHGKLEWDFFPSGVVTGKFSALENPEEKTFTEGSEGSEEGTIQQKPEPSLPSLSSVKNLDPDGFPIREWISEDWFFCEHARSLGYKTYVDTRIALGHVGQKEYRFGADQLARLDSEITSWREIHGWFDYEDLYREIAGKIGDGRSEMEDRSSSPSQLPTSNFHLPVFVEVGCWLGRSIGAMAEFCSELRAPGSMLPELHVVDTFQGKPANDVQASMLEAHGGNIEKAFRANMQALGLHVVDGSSKIEDDSSQLPTPNSQLLFVHAEPSDLAVHSFANGSVDAVFIDGDHSMEAVYADISLWWPKVKPGGLLAGHDIDEEGVSAAVRGAFAEFETRGRCWVKKKERLTTEIAETTEVQNEK